MITFSNQQCVFNMKIVRNPAFNSNPDWNYYNSKRRKKLIGGHVQKIYVFVLSNAGFPNIFIVKIYYLLEHMNQTGQTMIFLCFADTKKCNFVFFWHILVFQNYHIMYYTIPGLYDGGPFTNNYNLFYRESLMTFIKMELYGTILLVITPNLMSVRILINFWTLSGHP